MCYTRINLVKKKLVTALHKCLGLYLAFHASVFSKIYIVIYNCCLLVQITPFEVSTLKRNAVFVNYDPREGRKSLYHRSDVQVTRYYNKLLYSALRLIYRNVSIIPSDNNMPEL